MLSRRQEDVQQQPQENKRNLCHYEQYIPGNAIDLLRHNVLRKDGSKVPIVEAYPFQNNDFLSVLVIVGEGEAFTRVGKIQIRNDLLDGADVSRDQIGLFTPGENSAILCDQHIRTKVAKLHGIQQSVQIVLCECAVDDARNLSFSLDRHRQHQHFVSKFVDLGCLRYGVMAGHSFLKIVLQQNITRGFPEVVHGGTRAGGNADGGKGQDAAR